MFDEGNLYANIPAEEFSGDQPSGQYIHEAPVAALPAANSQGIPTGDTGLYEAPVQQHQTPGAAMIPVGDGAGAMAEGGGYYPYEGIEPEDTSPEAAGRSAGLTALFVAGSIGLGYAIGGWKGAVAGGVLSGAVANGYRAQKNFSSADPDQKHEAVVSSVFAVSGLGLGAFVVYEAMKERGEYGDEE
jgi:hypothetical protein